MTDKRKSDGLRKLTTTKLICKDLGVSRQYLHKDLNDLIPMPDPVGKLGTAPVYDVAEIKEWLEKLKTAREENSRTKRLIDNANGYFTKSELAEKFGYPVGGNMTYYIRSKDLDPVDPSLLLRSTKVQYRIADLEAHIAYEKPKGYVTAQDLAEETKLAQPKIYGLIRLSGVSPLPQTLSGRKLYKRSEVLDFIKKHR